MHGQFNNQQLNCEYTKRNEEKKDFNHGQSNFQYLYIKHAHAQTHICIRACSHTQ